MRVLRPFALGCLMSYAFAASAQQQAAVPSDETSSTPPDIQRITAQLISDLSKPLPCVSLQKREYLSNEAKTQLLSNCDNNQNRVQNLIAILSITPTASIPWLYSKTEYVEYTFGSNFGAFQMGLVFAHGEWLIDSF